MKRQGGGVRVDSKGYLVIKAGPLRDVRVHRLVAEAMLGRPLDRSEDVHHRDGNKLNCHPSNLQVMGHAEHSAVSAKQHWFLKNRERQQKEEWESYFDGDEAGV